MGIFPSQRKVVSEENGTIIIDTGTCQFCGKGGTVTMPKHAWDEYADGEGASVQYAWPEGSKGDREQLMNGTHDACFQKMFPPERE